jgi:3-oxoacyl-[acyl-carrier protein] reductase
MHPRLVAITGTSRGLGRSLAERFIASGSIVVGCSRGDSTLDSVSNYHHSTVDVTDEQSVRAWVRDIKRVHDRAPEVLVCNVGLVKLGALVGLTTLPDFQAFVGTILTGTFIVCREFSKQMSLQRSGRIINITSIMTELHAPGTAGYAPAKAAVVEFTKVLAAEVADAGITCNVVSPSVIAGESSSAFGEGWMQRMLDMQTIKRAVDPDDIYRIVEFFASPDASCITGQVLHTCLVN